MIFGQPVVEAGEDREHRAAEQHVVEVRDDEVRVGHLLVERDDREHHAGQAADHEHDDEAERRRATASRAPAGRATIVASHANTWMPLGIAITMLAAAKNVIVSCGSPTANMWCTQTPKPEERGRHRREHHPACSATIGRRAEDRDDRRDDPDRGQEDDVDVGVAEDPEQVLPEQRIAAVRDVEEVEAALALRARAAGSRRSARGSRRRSTSDVASTAQQKSGIRLIDIPGARSLTIVTMKLIAPAVVEMPRKIRPSP